VVQVNSNVSLTFNNVIERNVAPTNVETVNYLKQVVRVVPDRWGNRRTFIADRVTNFCNLDFCVSLERLTYHAVYSFGIGDTVIILPHPHSNFRGMSVTKKKFLISSTVTLYWILHIMGPYLGADWNPPSEHFIIRTLSLVIQIFLRRISSFFFILRRYLILIIRRLWTAIFK